MSKIRVGIVFGGQSAEHEVSIASAKNVIAALDPSKYDVLLINIDRSGSWHLREALENGASQKQIGVISEQGEGTLMHLHSSEKAPLHVVFPVLHGTFGEDGAIQGLLKMTGIPFVGAGILGSAVGMDKDVMKRLLRDAGLPIGKFLVQTRKDQFSYQECVKQLGSPLFIKPANAGSSVGVSKVNNETSFKKAVEEAFVYDRKILIEEYIEGREIECSVLGNEHPIASLPGEIIPTHEFYSYEAKYLDEKGALLEVPAKLTSEQTQEVQRLAIRVFQTLCCEGMGRVDCFLTKEGKFYVNEINTIPGFTQISMYPKLWQASGLSYRELLDRLIELALERAEQEKKVAIVYKQGEAHV